MCLGIKLSRSQWLEIILKAMELLITLSRSVKDGSPRLLFDYVLKEMEVKVGKAQYHAMMRVQSSLKFLELARYIKLRGASKKKRDSFCEFL